jgi:hypothetical protein
MTNAIKVMLQRQSGFLQLVYCIVRFDRYDDMNVVIK